MAVQRTDKLLTNMNRIFWSLGAALILMTSGIGGAEAAVKRGAQVKSGAQAKSAKPVAVGKRSKQALVNKGKVSSKVSKKVSKKAALLAKRKGRVPVVIIPAKPSFGELAGLHNVHDGLDLKSSVALVIDQDTHEVLFSKNEQAVLPIASLTKLMTGIIVSEARLPMDEIITINQDDLDTEKGSRSRLSMGAQLTRRELMHIALMSSENRAASALGRTHPGGLPVFVGLMNAKARMLGMKDTRFVEPTGLSSKNLSSAHDLALLVNAASQYPMLREYSTSHGYQVAVGNRVLQYNNTNRLVKNPVWDIGLQKTGYISEAGRCLVMQTKVAGRKLIMVFLDSAGQFSRLGDAERVRHWLEAAPVKRAAVVSMASPEKLALN